MLVLNGDQEAFFPLTHQSVCEQATRLDQRPEGDTRQLAAAYACIL